jgi:signal transduction histidine kinase
MLPRPRLSILFGLLVFAQASGAEVAPAAGVSPSERGYAVIDVPVSSQQFVDGPVLALARTSDGELVVGSNRLATFDGHAWQRIEVPDATRFLALAVDSGPGADVRVWYVAEGALGYVERHADGEWLSTALTVPLIAAGLTDLNDIVAVEPDGHGAAIFVTRSRVLRWDGTTFRIWELPSAGRLYSFKYRGELYVCQPGVGLFRMLADGPQLRLRQAELPGGQAVVALIDVPSGEDLAVSNNEELYRQVPGGWEKLVEASALLRGRRLVVGALKTDADTIALGTANGGLMLTRTDGSLVSLVNTRSGLPDDTTDKMLSDGDSGLWIGTGSGLVRLTGAGRTSLFDQREFHGYGNFQRVLEHAGRTWVLASHRAHELVPTPATEPARFNRLETFWPRLYDGVERAGNLWLCGTGGLWRVQDGLAVREQAVTGDAYQLATPEWLPDGLVYTDRHSLNALLPDGTGWHGVTLYDALESPPVSLLLDRVGRLWISTRSGGVRAFRWDAGAHVLRLLAHLQPGRGLPVGTHGPSLVPWGEGVAILTDSAVLTCTNPREPVVSVARLADFVVDHAMALPDGDMLLSVRHKALGPAAPQAIIRVRLAAGPDGISWIPVVTPGLDHIGSVNSMNLTGPSGKEVLWIGGNNALLRIEGLSLDVASPVPAVHLLDVRFNGMHRAVLRSIRRQIFGPEITQLSFGYSTGAGGEALFYQSRLAGIEHAWSPPQTVPGREFTGLPAGTYEFEVRAIDRFGRAGPVATYAFLLESPWYRRPWALASWAVLLGLAVFGAVRWRFRRLKNHATRLTQLVNERTRELSLSNTARAEFLDSLSHELRRPLNGLASLILRLEGSGLTPAQKKHAQLLRQGTESLTRVCDEVLDYSRHEYGAVPLTVRPFRLKEVLEEAVAEGSPDGPPPVLHFPREFVDGFVGDDLKLKTVATNFVANAQKHAAGAAVEIAVSCADEAAGMAHIIIEVSDGGPGVPAEEQELIFKRFVRGSRARQGRVPGSGIGLATCQMMARLLGGSVGVESPAERAREAGWPGPGSTFFVSLSLRRAPSDAAGLKAPLAAPGSS